MSIRLRALALLLACCLVGLPATPAHAAADTAKLIIKGVGSGYSGVGDADYPALVGRTVKAGATAKYAARVVNYGAEPAQFTVTLSDVPDLWPTTTTLKVGATDVTAVAEGAGYTTPVIEPGSYLQLSLKVATSPESPPVAYDVASTQLYLSSTVDDLLSFGAFFTMIRHPDHGTSGTEVYARQGGQPWVGGDNGISFAGSPAIHPGGSATFKVKYQNDGTDTHAMRGGLVNFFEDCMEYTAKRGRTDITADLLAGDYLTRALAPGQSEAIKVVAYWTGEPCGGSYAGAAVTAESLDEAEFSYTNIQTPLLADYGPPA